MQAWGSWKFMENRLRVSIGHESHLSVPTVVIGNLSELASDGSPLTTGGDDGKRARRE